MAAEASQMHNLAVGDKNLGVEICCKCGEDIESQSLSCMGKRWHVSCFRCVVCDKELGGGKFKASDGMPWCHSCYLEQRAPKCMVCHEAIEGKHMVVMSLPMHVSCFKCEVCEEALTAFRPAELADGRTIIACPKCFVKVDDHKEYDQSSCTACGREIQADETPFVWEEQPWHATCFKCQFCDDDLGPDNIPVKKNGLPCCQKCGRGKVEKQENKCYHCRKEIKDVVVKALGKKYHRQCVRCAYCDAALFNKGVEASLRIDELGQPCCHSCYSNQISEKLRKVEEAARLQAEQEAAAEGLPPVSARRKTIDLRKLMHGATKAGEGFMQIRIRRALDLFHKEQNAREAYIVFHLGLQVLYTGKRTVAKAQRETVWDEVWEFRKIDVSDTAFEFELMWRQKVMGSARLFLKDLPAGISTQEFTLPDTSSLFVEFTWRPFSAAKRDEAFQSHWQK